MTEKLKEVQYKASLKFAKLLTAEQKGNLSDEEWARKHTDEWVVRMEKMAEIEANELVVDISTGKVLGKRKDVERRGGVGF